MKLVADLIFCFFFLVIFKVIRPFSQNKLSTLIYKGKNKKKKKRKREKCVAEILFHLFILTCIKKKKSSNRS